MEQSMVTTGANFKPHRRVLSMEESIRESSQKTVELESQLRRLAEENAILEEQNKAFALYQVTKELQLKQECLFIHYPHTSSSGHL